MQFPDAMTHSQKKEKAVMVANPAPLALTRSHGSGVQCLTLTGAIFQEVEKAVMFAIPAELALIQFHVSGVQCQMLQAATACWGRVPVLGPTTAHNTPTFMVTQVVGVGLLGRTILLPGSPKNRSQTCD